MANVYAPNFSLFPDLSTRSLIIGGDFNCWLDPVLDRSSSNPAAARKSSSHIKSFLSDFGVSDIWRFLHPSTKEYSYFSNVHHTYTRIDYFFIDNKLISHTRSCEFQSIVISDHAPLVLGLSFPNRGDRKRHWRFNTALLSDLAFVTWVSKQISLFLETNQTPEVSCLTVWDTLKAYLRGQIISFVANKHKSLYKKRIDLSTEILNLDKQYAQTPTPSLYKKRLELKTEFDLHSTYHVERLLRKTKTEVYEHGEKSGRILANQLRGMQAKQMIMKIRNIDEVTTDPAKINDKFKEFYSKLYTSEFQPNTQSMDAFLGQVDFPQVSEDVKNRLDEPITADEITVAISSMQSGKSPGPDGFPSEFYRASSAKLVPLLASVLEESFRAGGLPPTFNQACITLIAKKGKDPEDCASYRPISLLNADVKILAKVLARRLEDALPSVIHTDQTGFVKNRHSFFNVRRLLNILYSPNNSVPECVVSLDAEKAFDRVEWSYLFTVLEKFGFGSTFISWIKLLYTSPTASVVTNSACSKPFQLQRGTRQGCPLSPLLFDLAIEPLAIALRCSSHLSGIWRGGVEHRVSLYADDLLLYISHPDISLPTAISLLGQFSEFSGYKLNLHKNELFPINANALKLEYANIPLKIEKCCLTYLGVSITKKHKDLFKENFIRCLNQVKQDITK